MKTGLSLTDLARKIEANKDLKQDYVADTGKALALVVQSDNKPALHLDKVGDFPLLPLAHNQIGQHTGIPRDYYERMLNGRYYEDRNGKPTLHVQPQPQLLVNNVNTWFKANPQRRRPRVPFQQVPTDR